MRVSDILSEDKFDYLKFEADVKEWCKKNGRTMDRISEDVLIRNRSYLSSALSKKRMPANVVVVLAKMMEVDVKDYKTEKKKAPAAKKEEKVVVAESKKGWSCYLKVDEEIGVVLVKIIKDGEELASSRAYTYGSTDKGIVQGISYAAHACYKAMEQDDIARAVMKEEEDDSDVELPARVCFRDWVKKYEKDSSKAGMLARFVGANYEKVPASGRKKIRNYLKLNGGAVHLVTFDTMWAQYFKWLESNDESGRVGVR